MGEACSEATDDLRPGINNQPGILGHTTSNKHPGSNMGTKFGEAMATKVE